MEERYHRQFETAKDGILLIDAHSWRVIDVNPFLLEWLGYSKEELLADDIRSAPVWFDPQSGEELFKEILETEVAQRDGVTMRSKPGTIFEAAIIGNIYQENGSRVIQLNIRDVTARKRAEDALRRSEERFRLFSDNVCDYAFLLMDLNGCVINWNAGAERLLGYTEEEILGKPVTVFFTPEDLRAGMAESEIQKAIREGRAEDERWHVRKDGSRFWASGVMTPVLDNEGHLRGWAKVMRDMTEKRLAQEALTKQAQELARSNNDLQQFAYVTSHDLQEPLRMISSYAQLLAKRYKGKLDKDADEFIGFMVEGVDRMSSLIRDLLTYSRVLTLETAPFAPADLNAVLQWALMNLKLVVENNDAVVTSDSLPVVDCIQMQMVQLFQNLIENAVKYRSQVPPRIHISMQEREREWIFSVQDNGIGIDPKYHERIFGVFKRLHAKEVPGTGIGLALCKKIVENHGGRIWVESELGKGATFRFTLSRNGGVNE